MPVPVSVFVSVLPPVLARDPDAVEQIEGNMR